MLSDFGHIPSFIFAELNREPYGQKSGHRHNEIKKKKNQATINALVRFETRSVDGKSKKFETLIRRNETEHIAVPENFEIREEAQPNQMEKERGERGESYGGV